MTSVRVRLRSCEDVGGDAVSYTDRHTCIITRLHGVTQHTHTHTHTPPYLPSTTFRRPSPHKLLPPTSILPSSRGIGYNRHHTHTHSHTNLTLTPTMPSSLTIGLGWQPHHTQSHVPAQYHPLSTTQHGGNMAALATSSPLTHIYVIHTSLSMTYI
jgi:hypothetical protein